MRLYRSQLLAIACVCVVSAGAALGDESSKRAEIVKLVHNTGELRFFRERVKSMMKGMAERFPTMPSWVWDEEEANVNADEYAQWIVAILDRNLSEDDARALNAVYGDMKMKALLDDLFARLSGKSGPEFLKSVQEFRAFHDSSTAEELIVFMQSSTFVNYAAAMTEKDKGLREIIINLVADVDRRTRAKYKSKR